MRNYQETTAPKATIYLSRFFSSVLHTSTDRICWVTEACRGKNTTHIQYISIQNNHKLASILYQHFQKTKQKIADFTNFAAGLFLASLCCSEVFQDEEQSEKFLLCSYQFTGIELAGNELFETDCFGLVKIKVTNVNEFNSLQRPIQLGFNNCVNRVYRICRDKIIWFSFFNKIAYRPHGNCERNKIQSTAF